MFSWLTHWFRPARQSATAAQAHMTFGNTSVGRSIARTGLFLKKQLWIWPIIAVVLLAAIGWTVSSAIERTIKENLRSQLQTLLGVERSMLETWLKVQESNAESLANDQQIRDAATQLLAASQPQIEDGATVSEQPPAAATTRAAPAALHYRLAQELGPGMTSHQFVSFFVADKQRLIIAATNTELIGQTIPQYESFLTRSLDGQTAVSPPFPSVVSMKDEFGRVRTGVPTMFVSAPIRDANFQVVAALALRIRPEREFTRILQLGRIGDSGETYAFDKTGLMVSNSRFDERLILLGLLPDVENSHSILNISLRDPGGNMLEGFRPAVRRAELPLTKMCVAAIAGTPGVNVDGANDYRGVPIVAAWDWLPNYNLGVTTKIDYAEAFRPLTILRWAFYSMYALLAVSAAAIFVFTLVVARLQREAQKAAIEAKQLGQYRLDTRIGAGAMGVVYKGHHAMLRRPTAIKMLNVDKVNDASIQRFEREVQITCKLNNPNTVAIYDYGRTPEGVFYYAMEFLDGIDLQALVENYGPQPEGRVIDILQQICSSLYEAHSLGLVHRDIKPANIMLNRRGGEPDRVKVLDFGLVKALDDEKQAKQTGGLAGTPLYMPPEAIQTPDLVDARSDLYAVGAVGYFLLTGQPVFLASSLVELCQQHVTAMPVAPSQRLGKAVSQELESALLACLEKSKAKRPQTARDLSILLDRAPTAGSWSIDDAEAWWGRHERGQAAVPAAASAPAARGTVSGAGSGTIASSSAFGAVGSPAAAQPQTGTSTSGFDRTIDR
jgi:eukaryotic-like serine/threonine-protein kinase